MTAEQIIELINGLRRSERIKLFSLLKLHQDNHPYQEIASHANDCENDLRICREEALEHYKTVDGLRTRKKRRREKEQTVLKVMEELGPTATRRKLFNQCRNRKPKLFPKNTESAFHSFESMLSAMKKKKWRLYTDVHEIAFRETTEALRHPPSR
jgi:hypothetical protein